jgi:ferric-dicitrate binding protein FerR (iron transport regulator)
MLSQHDRRRLEAIERQLQREDPDLAHRLTRWPPSPSTRWAKATAILVVVLGALGVLLGLMLFSPALLVLSATGTLGGWSWLYRRTGRATGGTGGTRH